ncbi:MAG: hypothetical protein JST40_03495 [Armatimonadetes bacterium]|nr:hypothetical protein [Armatimonadota bacterium]
MEIRTRLTSPFIVALPVVLMVGLGLAFSTRGPAVAAGFAIGFITGLVTGAGLGWICFAIGRIFADDSRRFLYALSALVVGGIKTLVFLLAAKVCSSGPEAMGTAFMAALVLVYFCLIGWAATKGLPSS